jgi:hypothetical protein
VICKKTERKGAKQQRRKEFKSMLLSSLRLCPFASLRFVFGCVPILFTMLIGCAHHAPAHSSVQLLDLDNNPVDFQHQTKSRTTVLLFTRTDCPISNRLAPEIRDLHAKFHPRGVDFYLVYVDPREDAAAIRQHLKEYGYPCAALRDPEHALVAYCNATTTPEAALFTADHRLVYEGRITDRYVELGNARSGAVQHDLASAIESTLNGQPVATAKTRPIGCPIADLKE